MPMYSDLLAFSPLKRTITEQIQPPILHKLSLQTSWQWKATIVCFFNPEKTHQLVAPLEVTAPAPAMPNLGQAQRLPVPSCSFSIDCPYHRCSTLAAMCCFGFNIPIVRSETTHSKVLRLPPPCRATPPVPGNGGDSREGMLTRTRRF